MLVLVGANQAELARDLELDLAGSGLLVSVFSVGLGAGVLGVGARLAPVALVFGATGAALGLVFPLLVALVAAAPWPRLLSP